MIPDLMRPIRLQVDRFVGNLPLPARRDFMHYLHRARRNNHQRTTLRAGNRIPPYWLLLPWWIGKTYTQNSGSQVLKDILWGQYCLYLGIRIRDDVFDGQANDKRLGLASSAFLEEGKKAFLMHFLPSSVFWTYHHRCTQTTQAAIFRVDRIQRSDKSRPSHLLPEYARVSAIFKVGAVAACFLFHREEWIPRISRFADALATAGQILDDFQDISEDFTAGRLNYAARFCLRRLPRKPRSQAQRSSIITNQIFLKNAPDGIFAVARHHLDLAATALSSLPLPGGHSYMNRYYAQLDKYEKDLRSRRTIPFSWLPATSL